MAREFEKMKTLRNIGSYAVLALALGAMTFFGVCDPQQGGNRLSGAAAKVADESVSALEFRRVYNRSLQYIRNTGQDPVAMRLANLLLNQLVNERVGYLMAKDNGFIVSDTDIEKRLLEDKNFKDNDGKFSADRFSKLLKYQGFSEASFTETLRRQLSLQRVDDFVASSFYVSKHAAKWEYILQETKFDVDYIRIDGNRIKVPVSDEDVKTFMAEKDAKDKVKKYYDTNKDDYVKKARRKARHILVSFKGARNASGDGAKRKKEDAKKGAEDLRGKVVAAGADFAAIAKKETDEPSGKTSGGDLGWFDRKKMVKEFSDAAFALNNGDVSQVVESPFGFHIIKVEGAEEEKVTSLEQAETKIAKVLIETKKRPDYATKLADEIQGVLGKKAELEALLKKNDIKWDNTGEFAANAGYLPGLGGNQKLKDAVIALEKPNQTTEKPIKDSQVYYILKLKKRTKPDLKKLDDKKMEELQMFSAMRISRQVYGSIRSSFSKELEDKKKIWKNPDFLALDKPRNNS